MKQWLIKFINIGITPALAFDDIRKIKILNLIGLLGIIVSSYFFILNILDGKNLLAGINFITSLSGFFLVFANYKHYYYYGQVIVSMVVSISFAVSSLLYHNNMEYYLLLIIGIVLILFKDVTTIILFTIINSIAFLWLLKYGNNYHFYEPVTKERGFINMMIWLIFFLIFLQYFKKQSNGYQKQIEDKNNQLEDNQMLLLKQKYALEDSNNQLQISNSTKEKLFSIVAHDVRTPIAGLKTSLELFNQDIISKEEFLMLSKGLSIQVDQLQNSLENLLQWSHSQMQGLDIKKEKIPLNPLILETLNLLQQNLLAKNINIDLASHEIFMIEADPNHIKLVLRNLIGNAIKYSYAGSSIAISAKKENAFILFSVDDAGTGMSKEKVDTLLMQNSIVSEYGTINEKGTGLGLMLCKEFIDKNGGSLFVESEIGKGSVFTFSVPAA